MNHAGNAALDLLEPLLQALRDLPGPVEKSRGVFYLKSRAFLHFHEDPAGLFADLRAPGASDFVRFALTDAAAREALLAEVRSALAASPPKAPIGQQR